MIATVEESDIRTRLLEAGLPTAVRACEFFVEPDTDDYPTIVVVMIVSYGDWDDAAEQACVEASAAAWSALSDLDAFVDVVCRTKAEHDESRGEGPWVALDDDC